MRTNVMLVLAMAALLVAGCGGSQAADPTAIARQVEEAVSATLSARPPSPELEPTIVPIATQTPKATATPLPKPTATPRPTQATPLGHFSNPAAVGDVLTVSAPPDRADPMAVMRYSLLDAVRGSKADTLASQELDRYSYQKPIQGQEYIGALVKLELLKYEETSIQYLWPGWHLRLRLEEGGSFIYAVNGLTEFAVGYPPLEGEGWVFFLIKEGTQPYLYAQPFIEIMEAGALGSLNWGAYFRLPTEATTGRAIAATNTPSPRPTIVVETSSELGPAATQATPSEAVLQEIGNEVQTKHFGLTVRGQPERTKVLVGSHLEEEAKGVYLVVPVRWRNTSQISRYYDIQGPWLCIPDPEDFFGCVSEDVFATSAYHDTQGLYPSGVDSKIASHASADDWVVFDIREDLASPFLRVYHDDLNSEIVAEIPLTASTLVDPTPIPTEQRSQPSPTIAQVTSNPACPHAGCQITYPGLSNQRITGIVPFRGTADIPDLEYYKLEYRAAGTEDWLFLVRIDGSVANGELMEWHTYTVPPGDYEVRLVVVDIRGNYPEPCIVRVTVY